MPVEQLPAASESDIACAVHCRGDRRTLRSGKLGCLIDRQASSRQEGSAEMNGAKCPSRAAPPCATAAAATVEASAGQEEVSSNRCIAQGPTS